MKKRLQLTLLLSCILMLCSHSINAIGEVGVWSAAYALEEPFSATDNDDLDGALSKTSLFTAFLLLEQQQSFFDSNTKKVRLTHCFIRAPPKYNI
ncbi:MAG: hypothetical protein HRU22_09395 [Gammaproteobacteria bacterium]|nr:hypothetical protein [Gammaproteobacteria bacterium]